LGLTVDLPDNRAVGSTANPTPTSEYGETASADASDEKPPATGTGSSGASIFTALEEQFGLKLVSQKVRVEFLVVDWVEKPSED
jgi:uncharacterized protein (TIGR03435 family)